jgi:hypothetical protein
MFNPFISLPRGTSESTPTDIQKEAIYFPGYGSKIPNRNTQISNNIKIKNSNDQNISTTYWMSRVILVLLNFGHS